MPFDGLDDVHEQALTRAVKNILSLDSAVNAYAQILDGLPTEEGIECTYIWGIPYDHPVAGHEHVCEGFLDQARQMRDNFQLTHLSFEPWVINAFQETVPGTDKFNLRLIELVAISCHQIGAQLYEKDGGNHKHQVLDDWYRQAQANVEKDPGFYKQDILGPLAFTHHLFKHPERCPRGAADIAGYWVEAKIFGGVLVFDRGESERECKSVWLSGEARSPYTLYPPTDVQFKALIEFFSSGPEDEGYLQKCPLPIPGTADNRPRWEPFEAQTKFHIFRDKNALEIPIARFANCYEMNGYDWPEVSDQNTFTVLQCYKDEGEVYDPELLESVKRGMNWITPTSPTMVPPPDWFKNRRLWLP